MAHPEKVVEIPTEEDDDELEEEEDSPTHPSTESKPGNPSNPAEPPKPLKNKNSLLNRNKKDRKYFDSADWAMNQTPNNKKG